MNDAPGGKSPREALTKSGPGTQGPQVNSQGLTGEAIVPCPTGRGHLHLSAWPAISCSLKTEFATQLPVPRRLGAEEGTN